jgi:hypothetical protein
MKQAKMPEVFGEKAIRAACHCGRLNELVSFVSRWLLDELAIFK